MRPTIVFLGLLTAALLPRSAAAQGVVVPTVDCVEETDNGGYRAYFGYEVTGATPVTVPLGHDNRYQGGQTDDDPATDFSPGVHAYAFEATFPNRLTWSIRTGGTKRMVRADQRHPKFNDCDPPSDSDNEPESEGVLSLDGASATAFNAAGPQTLTVLVDGAAFSPDTTLQQAIVNGAYLRPTAIGPTALQFDVVLQPGRNDVSILAVDTGELPIRARYVLWAGSGTQAVTVTDEAGAPLDGAVVRSAIVDDLDVAAEGVTQGGTVVFENVPPRTLIVTAEAAPNRFGTAGALGNGSPVTVVALGFDAPSAVANNDFALGLDGWDVTSGVTDGSVDLVPHEEEVGPGDEETPTEEVPGEDAPEFSGASADADIDLELGTGGEGPQRVSRAFQIEPGTRSVTVRYRFVTTEVPGGYYGTEFNDYYGVTVRSETGGGRSSEQNSMNGLGLAAFDASGGTAWREVELPVSEDGDLVQVDLVVANVGDGAYPSRVVVDRVRQSPLSIRTARLKDNTRGTLRACHGSSFLEDLQFFSMGTPIPYRNGNTWVWGDLTLEGSPDDAVTDVRLEAVLGSGNVITSGSLSSAAEGELIRPFGSSGRLTTSQSGTTPLFVVPQSRYPKSGVITLRVRATAASGTTARRTVGQYPVLVRYHWAEDRFGPAGRDAEQGGDDWGLESVVILARRIARSEAGAGILYNDFSNMNGGKFPIHCTHREGDVVDATFPGLPNKSAAAAQKILDILNGPYGRQIRTVQTTFTWGSSFGQTIRNAGALADGRPASAVVTPLSGHPTHMHVTFDVGAGAAGGSEFASAASAGPTGQAWTDRGPRSTDVGPAPARAAVTAADGPLAVAVAPNPVAGGRLAFRLSGTAGADVRVVVFDVVGRRVAETELAGATAGALDVGSLAPGTYVLRVTAGDEVATSTFVVVR